MQVIENEDVIITAATELVDASSENGFLWGYYFCIENNSDETITLVGKDWNITDDNGNRFFDTTDGFKGEIPEIEPGEFFEFSSTAPLKAANAVFHGVCKIMKNKVVENIKMPILQFDVGTEKKLIVN